MGIRVQAKAGSSRPIIVCNQTGRVDSCFSVNGRGIFVDGFEFVSTSANRKLRGEVGEFYFSLRTVQSKFVQFCIFVISNDSFGGNYTSRAGGKKTKILFSYPQLSLFWIIFSQYNSLMIALLNFALSKTMIFGCR